MNTPNEQGVGALSEKEKQTLRLIVRGYDAKSTARRLGLSVHTINERLRGARRKMMVSSSREAARLLLEAEQGNAMPPTPESFGDKQLGEDAGAPTADHQATPIRGAGKGRRRFPIIIGGLCMTFVLGFLALAALPQSGSAPTATPTAAATTVNPQALAMARHWLELLDRGDWKASYAQTTASFQKHNTLQAWTKASERARVPLGAMQSRTLLSADDMPAPPHGYTVLKFKIDYANRPDAVVTLSLDREDGNWRVAGVYIE
ncbi:hypothetical protein GCM10023219_16690 [Stakelama sediminis]|uniref:DNA-binding CsgD family transcriptional regulator n=1 Tax=Stakelama sediminis TaxID=463200 RepID=A0A840YXK3_9SPHN|nr:DUF4019 domain-containing protein [Stakelama sediminis]MBB5718398.1 DNA-binding CsgD family transcriptional regulator [Stakelama sediminis]